MANEPDPKQQPRVSPLRAEIERLTNGTRQDGEDNQQADGARPMSPREFIQKRMRELRNKSTKT
jgi:hypothetical protein